MNCPKKQLSSPLFLAYAIILAVLTLSYAIFAVETLVSAPLIGAVLCAATVCTAIGAAFAFVVFFSKGDAKASSVKKINVYYTAMLILSVAELIFAGIAAGFTLVICLIIAILLLAAKNATEFVEKVFGAIELGELSINEILDGGSAIIAIAGIIISSLVIFIFVCKVVAFKKSSKYISAIATLCESNQYSEKRAPSVKLWMYAIISLIISIIGFGFGIGCGIAFVMTGALMIVSALLFSKVHKLASSDEFVKAAESTAPSVSAPTAQYNAPAPNPQYNAPVPNPQYNAPAQRPQAQPVQGYAPYQQGQPSQYRAPAPTAQPQQSYAPYQGQPQGYAPYPNQRPAQGYAPYQGQPTQPTQGYAPYQPQPTQPMQGYVPYQGQPQGYAPYQPQQSQPAETQPAPEEITADEAVANTTEVAETAVETEAVAETAEETETVTEAETAPEAQDDTCDECNG